MRIHPNNSFKKLVIEKSSYIPSTLLTCFDRDYPTLTNLGDLLNLNWRNVTEHH